MTQDNLPRPDFSLNLWKPTTQDQFVSILHELCLNDASDSLVNKTWDFPENSVSSTGEWATVFYECVAGDSGAGEFDPVVMILHREDDDKTKLLYFRRI